MLKPPRREYRPMTDDEKTRYDETLRLAAERKAEKAQRWGREVVAAADLSCRGLWDVETGPNGSAPYTFHGTPVEGYPEEMERRAEHHVFGCVGPCPYTP
jgi:hypothetical protein